MGVNGNRSTLGRNTSDPAPNVKVAPHRTALQSTAEDPTSGRLSVPADRGLSLSPVSNPSSAPPRSPDTRSNGHSELNIDADDFLKDDEELDLPLTP